mmetsp:Transcript_2008/g.6505  ORF Transcript_2008/g.6505 Transcript_2008/m.6505 type:complete len:267 (+) Transcript_2008:611-1411(+)
MLQRRAWWSTRTECSPRSIRRTCRKLPERWQSSRGKAGRTGFCTCRARRRFCRCSRQAWTGFGGSSTANWARRRCPGMQAPTMGAAVGVKNCAGSVCAWTNPASRCWTDRTCGALRGHRRTANGTLLHAYTRIQVIAGYLIVDLCIDPTTTPDSKTSPPRTPALLAISQPEIRKTPRLVHAHMLVPAIDLHLLHLHSLIVKTQVTPRLKERDARRRGRRIRKHVPSLLHPANHCRLLRQQVIKHLDLGFELQPRVVALEKLRVLTL